MTRCTGYDTQVSTQSFLNCLTCAGDSISRVSWFTCTFEAAYSVIAGGIGATSSVLFFTLVDICVVQINTIRHNITCKNLTQD